MVVVDVVVVVNVAVAVATKITPATATATATATTFCGYRGTTETLGRLRRTASAATRSPSVVQRSAVCEL